MSKIGDVKVRSPAVKPKSSKRHLGTVKAESKVIQTIVQL